VHGEPRDYSDLKNERAEGLRPRPSADVRVDYPSTGAPAAPLGDCCTLVGERQESQKRVSETAHSCLAEVDREMQRPTE
jgi:hypothetical protein